MKGQTVFTEVEGFGATAKDYDFGSSTAGAGQACASPAIVRCRSCCSGPPGSRSVRSHIDASVEPGKESSWRITYQFYQAASVKESKR